MLKKDVFTWHNKKHYLIGTDIAGTKYYLEEPSFDCGWYWGGLYIHSFSNNTTLRLSRDITAHWHFSRFFNTSANKNAYDAFNDFFRDTVLTEAEIWLLIDYAQSFYTLRHSAELFHIGGSYYTGKAYLEELKNPEIEKYLNEEAIPAVIKKICNLLEANNNESDK